MKVRFYTCWDCAFYKDGNCELKDERISSQKMPCRDFELG